MGSWLPSSQASTPSCLKPSPQRRLQLVARAVVHVAVVTVVARVVLTDVRADDPIAAARRRTGVGAGVAVVDVAVIASLKPNEDDAITAASEGAVGATGVR